MGWQYISLEDLPPCANPQTDLEAGIRTGLPIVPATSGLYFDQWWTPASEQTYWSGCPSVEQPQPRTPPPEVWNSNRHGVLDLNRRDANGRVNIRDDDGTIYSYQVATGTSRFLIDREYFFENQGLTTFEFNNLPASERSQYCSTPVLAGNTFRHFKINPGPGPSPEAPTAYSERTWMTARIWPAGYQCPPSPPPPPPPGTDDFYNENPVSLVGLWRYYAAQLGQTLDPDQDGLPDFTDFAGVVYEKLNPSTGTITTGVIPSNNIVLQDFYLTRPVGLGLSAPSGTVTLSATSATVYTTGRYTLRASENIVWPDQTASDTACGSTSRFWQYQWQYRSSNRGSWQNVPGSPRCPNQSSCALVIDTPSLSQNGWQYRAVVTANNRTECAGFSGGGETQIVSPVFTLSTDVEPCSAIRITSASIDASTTKINQPGAYLVNGSISVDPGTCGAPVSARLKWTAGNVLNNGTNILRDSGQNVNITNDSQTLFVSQGEYDVLKSDLRKSIPVEYTWTVEDSTGATSTVSRSLRLSADDAIGDYNIQIVQNLVNRTLILRTLRPDGTRIDLLRDAPPWWVEQHTYTFATVDPNQSMPLQGTASNSESASAMNGNFSGIINVNDDYEQAQFGPIALDSGDSLFYRVKSVVPEDTQVRVTIRDINGVLRGETVFTVFAQCTQPEIQSYNRITPGTPDPVIVSETGNSQFEFQFQATGVSGSCEGVDRYRIGTIIEEYSSVGAYPDRILNSDGALQGDFRSLGTVGPGDPWVVDAGDIYGTATMEAVWDFIVNGPDGNRPPLVPGEIRRYRFTYSLEVVDPSGRSTGIQIPQLPDGERQWVEFQVIGPDLAPAPQIVSTDLRCPTESTVLRSSTGNQRTFRGQATIINAVQPELVVRQAPVTATGTGSYTQITTATMTLASVGSGGQETYVAQPDITVPASSDINILGYTYEFTVSDQDPGGGTVSEVIGVCELRYAQLQLAPLPNINNVSPAYEPPQQPPFQREIQAVATANVTGGSGDYEYAWIFDNVLDEPDVLQGFPETNAPNRFRIIMRDDQTVVARGAYSVTVTDRVTGATVSGTGTWSLRLNFINSSLL